MNRVGVVGFWVALLVSSSRLGCCGEAAHNFSRWEKEISALERAERSNPPPRGGWVFTGSSTVRRWTTLERDLPGHTVINRGFGGSEILDATHFAERVIFPCEPTKVFLRAGGNDIYAGKSPEQVFADFREFVAKVHEKLPATEVVFISLSPSIARWSQAGKEKALNAMVEEYVRQTPGVKHLETYDVPLGADGKPRPELFVADKLHFNAEGYRLLARRVNEVLAKQK